MSVDQTVILIGGLTGSGKTEIGQRLAQQLQFAYIDKDTLTRHLVDRLLVALKSPFGSGDRDSTIYREQVRPFEYACFYDALLENLSIQASFVATAPFLLELTSERWISNFRMHAGTAAVHLFWVDCDLDLTRDRLLSRSEERDSKKLLVWDKYREYAQALPRPQPEVRILDNGRHDSLEDVCRKATALISCG